MARSTRRRAVTALALTVMTASGCVSGHVWQAARRWERVESYREARVVGDRLLVRYTAAVTTDEALPMGERSVWAEIPLDELRAAPPVERFRVRRLDDAPGAGGAPVAIRSGPPDAGDAACALARPTLCVTGAGGAEGFVLVDEAGPYPPFHSAALTRTTTAPWVYPLLPVTFAVDSVMVPGLLLLAPMWIVAGD